MEINRLTTASFDVDAQKTFTPSCPDELPVPEGDQIVSELNAQAAFAKYRIGSKDAHSMEAIWVADDQNPVLSAIIGDNVDRRWPAHAIPGTEGFNLLPGLPTPKQYDYFIWKGIELDMHPYGACYHDLHDKLSTGIIEWLRANQVDTVLLGGLAFDYCVKTTAIQLAKANFQVIINLAATKAVEPENTNIVITECKSAGIQFVESAAELQT